MKAYQPPPKQGSRAKKRNGRHPKVARKGEVREAKVVGKGEVREADLRAPLRNKKNQVTKAGSGATTHRGHKLMKGGGLAVSLGRREEMLRRKLCWVIPR
ncbi:unnamed protein product [Linum trigynum]|uniref:Uncharacterized protein n=1 Tax=Linum trigynum TaxID=586398 RepID=A0AAV2DRP7_9ROSI